MNTFIDSIKRLDVLYLDNVTSIVRLRALDVIHHVKHSMVQLELSPLLNYKKYDGSNANTEDSLQPISPAQLSVFLLLLPPPPLPPPPSAWPFLSD